MLDGLIKIGIGVSMTAKKTKLGNKQSTIYSAGPWYVQVNHVNGACQVTSGDTWFTVPRSEAVKILLRKLG